MPKKHQLFIFSDRHCGLCLGRGCLPPVCRFWNWVSLRAVLAINNSDGAENASRNSAAGPRGGGGAASQRRILSLRVLSLLLHARGSLRLSLALGRRRLLTDKCIVIPGCEWQLNNVSWMWWRHDSRISRKSSAGLALRRRSAQQHIARGAYRNIYIISNLGNAQELAV